MSPPPLVTVIVPSFNQGRFLRAALDSILQQDYRPLEVWVIDGKSTDDSVMILEDYARQHPEVRWLSEPDGGPADAVNKGLQRAAGTYVAIQNSDDLFRPGALRTAIATYLAHPRASFVYGDVERIDERGEPIRGRRFPEFTWEAFFALSCTLAQSSIVFRRDYARQLGGWNRRYYTCDLDFWLRLAFKGTPIHIPQVLSAWRHHAGQRTRPDQYGRIWAAYWQMIEDCPELRAASPRLRGLARASCHLLALRFHPPGHRWTVLGHALRGLALHPGAVRYYPVREYFRHLLRRVGARVPGRSSP